MEATCKTNFERQVFGIVEQKTLNKMKMKVMGT